MSFGLDAEESRCGYFSAFPKPFSLDLVNPKSRYLKVFLSESLCYKRGALMVSRISIFTNRFRNFFVLVCFYQNNLIVYLNICENSELKLGIRETMW